MRKFVTVTLAGSLALALAGCYTPEERAGGGALIGAGTAPCPYGTYRDYYGNVYCR